MFGRVVGIRPLRRDVGKGPRAGLSRYGGGGADLGKFQHGGAVSAVAPEPRFQMGVN